MHKLAADPPNAGSIYPAGVADDEAEVIELERALLRSPSRYARPTLERVLAEDFVEFGQSGRCWNRAELVDRLVAAGTDGNAAAELDIQDRDLRAQRLAPDVILLTYVAVHSDGHSSRRSSVFRRGASGEWRMVFAQGTVIPPGLEP